MKKNKLILVFATMALVVAITSCGRKKEMCAAYDRVGVEQAK